MDFDLWCVTRICFLGNDGACLHGICTTSFLAVLACLRGCDQFYLCHFPSSDTRLLLVCFSTENIYNLDSMPFHWPDNMISIMNDTNKRSVWKPVMWLVISLGIIMPLALWIIISAVKMYIAYIVHPPAPNQVPALTLADRVVEMDVRTPDIKHMV